MREVLLANNTEAKLVGSKGINHDYNEKKTVSPCLRGLNKHYEMTSLIQFLIELS